MQSHYGCVYEEMFMLLLEHLLVYGIPQRLFGHLEATNDSNACSAALFKSFRQRFTVASEVFDYYEKFQVDQLVMSTAGSELGESFDLALV